MAVRAQCSQPAVPGIELPPFEWGLCRGRETGPLCHLSRTELLHLWAEGEEKHQQPVPPRVKLATVWEPEGGEPSACLLATGTAGRAFITQTW